MRESESSLGQSRPREFAWEAEVWMGVFIGLMFRTHIVVHPANTIVFPFSPCPSNIFVFGDSRYATDASPTDVGKTKSTMPSSKERELIHRRILLLGSINGQSCFLPCGLKDDHFALVREYDVGPGVDHLRGCFLWKPNHLSLEHIQVVQSHIRKEGSGEL